MTPVAWRKSSHSGSNGGTCVEVASVGTAVIAVRDSKDPELDRVSSTMPLKDAPVIRLDRCSGAIIRSSRAFPGTGTFLSVAPGGLGAVALEGNVLGAARKATEEASVDYWRTGEP